MFGWFDAKDAVAFAKTLVQDINIAFPPLQPPKPDKKGREKVAKDLEDVLQRGGAFVRDKRLNVYKKSKFLNTFKWELKELRYPEEFIDDMIKDLLRRM